MNNISAGLKSDDRNPEILSLLQEAQSRDGYLSKGIMCEIAESLGISRSDVYGIATFYSFLSTRPLGRNVIRVCKSLPCYLKNSEAIIESVANEIGIKPGETTVDGRYTLEMTNCIGACDKAPAMLINNDVHGELTPKKISIILHDYK